MAKRQANGSSGTGFSFAVAEVKEILPDRGIALVMDLNTGNIQDVGLNKRGETAWPQVGDRWLIDRSMGHWALQAKITGPEPPEFTGFFNTMDPDVLRLATVLKSLGLIKDAMTSGPVPDLEYTGSKNLMSPALIQLVELLDSLGVIDDQSTAQTLPVGVWQIVGTTPGAATYTSPWAFYQDPVSGSYQAPRYMIEADGFVAIEGLAKATTTVSGSPAIFTLPPGFRPVKNQLTITMSDATNFRQLEVLSTGVVRLAGIPAATTINWASLNMRFSTT
jgi:hypothetical protein